MSVADLIDCKTLEASGEDGDEGDLDKSDEMLLGLVEDRVQPAVARNPGKGPLASQQIPTGMVPGFVCLDPHVDRGEIRSLRKKLLRHPGQSTCCWINPPHVGAPLILAMPSTSRPAPS